MSVVEHDVLILAGNTLTISSITSGRQGIITTSVTCDRNFTTNETRPIRTEADYNEGRGVSLFLTSMVRRVADREGLYDELLTRTCAGNVTSTVNRRNASACYALSSSVLSFTDFNCTRIR